MDTAWTEIIPLSIIGKYFQCAFSTFVWGNSSLATDLHERDPEETGFAARSHSRMKIVLI